MSKTPLFDFENNDFLVENGKFVMIDGADALRQRVKKRLLTQKGKYKAYNSTGYGTDIEDLVKGKTFNRGFLASELKRECIKSLLQDTEIEEVSGFSIENIKDKVKIYLTLKTVYGKIEEVSEL